MDPVDGVAEHHLALGRCPADVIEMQVGEDHIGDVTRRHAVALEAIQELAAFVLASVDGARPGVDQDRSVAGANQKAADGELQSPMRVELGLMTGPGLGFGWVQQDVAGDLVTEAVENRQDLDIADFQMSPAITAE